jgi:outer membrane receptor protein involved in Fe transport
LLGCSGASAQQEPVEAERRADILVVTGVREQRSAEVPRSLSITTRDDLDRLPAINLVDLLGRAANLNLRSTLGNAKFSGVDIRGQGDTYTSNVLVMVDGIRLNAPDLSGADLSIVPVDLVERIEVIRGANTVRYGNGAVGGVINIITRTPAAGGEVGVRGRVGSFATRGGGADAAWGGAHWSAALAAEFNDTDGYRDNSELTQRDVRARIGYAPTEWFSAAVGALLHDDQYGLPGPVTAADFAGSDAARRQTRFPFDGGETDDDVLRADVTLGSAETGELRVVAFDRQRRNPFRIGAGAATPFGEIDEDTQRLDARFERSFQLGARQHSLIVGVDGNNSDYGRREGPLTTAGTTVKQGYLAQRGWFAAADLQLNATLKAALGYRQDSLAIDGSDGVVVDDLCDDLLVIGTGQNTVTLCNDPGGPRSGVAVDRAATDRWRNHAFEAGLVYSPTASTNIFLAYAESFRNPNVDELVLAAADLGPQTSRHWDAGIRHLAGDAVELGLAVFSSDTRDEILFFVPPFLVGSGAGPAPGEASLGLNRNAEQIVERLGGEADVRWNAASWLELTGNIGYTRARFAGSGARLPLVPEWTAGATALFTLAGGYSLSIAGSYVGPRPDGNDFSNTRFPQVASYVVADAKLSWERNGFSAYAGIANVFDEVYAASVYNEQFYPQAPRNFYAGFSYRIQSSG